MENPNIKECVDNGVEVDFSELIFVLIRSRKLIFISILVFGLFSIALSMYTPAIYTSTATILPPQSQSNSSLAAALGSLGAIGGGGGVAALKNPNDLYVGMLNSQRISNRLISKFSLSNRYEKKTLVDTRNSLMRATNIISGKDGIISISVEDEDPIFAAVLANAYIDELKELNQDMAVTDAARKRVFFETQLNKASKELVIAEEVLNKIQKTTGLIQPESQIRSYTESIENLKARIMSNELKMKSMQSFTTDKNPDYIKIFQETNAIKEKLKLIEGDLDVNRSGVNKISGDALVYLRAFRNFKYQESLFDMLSKQLELSKLEEAKEASLIQILDVAVAADKRTKPVKSLFLIIGLIAGLFVGLVMAIMFDSVKRSNFRIRFKDALVNN